MLECDEALLETADAGSAGQTKVKRAAKKRLLIGNSHQQLGGLDSAHA